MLILSVNKKSFVKRVPHLLGESILKFIEKSVLVASVTSESCRSVKTAVEAITLLSQASKFMEKSALEDGPEISYLCI